MVVTGLALGTQHHMGSLTSSSMQMPLGGHATCLSRAAAGTISALLMTLQLCVELSHPAVISTGLASMFVRAWHAAQ
jgi:hypothetical protein